MNDNKRYYSNKAWAKEFDFNIYVRLNDTHSQHVFFFIKFKFNISFQKGLDDTYIN